MNIRPKVFLAGLLGFIFIGLLDGIYYLYFVLFLASELEVWMWRTFMEYLSTPAGLVLTCLHFGSALLAFGALLWPPMLRLDPSTEENS